MSTPSSTSRTRRSFVLVLLLFSGLALALTWPLVTRLTTHVPGSDTWAYDEYTFLWNIWYFKSALIDQHISPLFTDLTFYPLGMGLVMYTFNLMAAALALPDPSGHRQHPALQQPDQPGLVRPWRLRHVPARPLPPAQSIPPFRLRTPLPSPHAPVPTPQPSSPA